MLTNPCLIQVRQIRSTPSLLILIHITLICTLEIIHWTLSQPNKQHLFSRSFISLATKVYNECYCNLIEAPEFCIAAKSRIGKAASTHVRPIHCPLNYDSLSFECLNVGSIIIIGENLAGSSVYVSVGLKRFGMHKFGSRVFKFYYSHTMNIRSTFGWQEGGREAVSHTQVNLRENSLGARLTAVRINCFVAIHKCSAWRETRL